MTAPVTPALQFVPPPAKPLPPATCTGFAQSPANKAGPNDAAVVCACGEDYLKDIAKQAAYLRARAQQLVQKPKAWPELASYYRADQKPGGVNYLPAEIEQTYRRFAPLEDYSTPHIAACEKWNSDRARLAEVPARFQFADKLNARLEQLKSARDELLRKDRELVSQPNWARTPANIPLHNQLLAQMRDAQYGIGQLGAQHSTALIAAQQLKKTLDTEQQKAKDSTYSEIEIAVGGLWGLYLQLATDTLSEINGEEAEYERQALAQWEADMKRIADKWTPIWKQQMAASPDYRNMTVDANSPRMESLPYFAPADRAQSGQVNALLAREQQLASELQDVRNRLRTDMQHWADFSGRDAWPTAGKPKTTFDFDASRVLLASSFQEFTNMALDGEQRPAPPGTDPNSVDGKGNVVFNFPTGPSGRENAWSMGAPHFELAVGPARGHPADAQPRFVIPVSENFGMEYQKFLADHPESTHWGGRLPASVRVYDYHLHTPTDISTTLPAGRGVTIKSDPFQAQSGQSVMFASGADRTQRP